MLWSKKYSVLAKFKCFLPSVYDSVCIEDYIANYLYCLRNSMNKGRWLQMNHLVHNHIYIALKIRMAEIQTLVASHHIQANSLLRNLESIQDGVCLNNLGLLTLRKKKFMHIWILNVTLFVTVLYTLKHSLKASFFFTLYHSQRYSVSVSWQLGTSNC